MLAIILGCLENAMTEPINTVEAEFTLLKQKFNGVKRRAAERYRCALATFGKLYFPADGFCLEAWAHNLSDSGIGLNVDRSLAAGTPLLVRLRGAVRNLTISLPARVVHSTQELDGSWRVGCAFDRQLTVEELEALL
jgi:PilZ domain-containing protein